jgi:hypothetical protein
MKATEKDLSNLKVPGGIKAIDDIAAGYKAYQVLMTATEKGLFDWLDEKGESTGEEISMAMNINGMFIRSFLQALVDMGMLTCKNDRFANTGIAADFLVGSKAYYQGDWLKTISGKGSKWDDLKATLMMDKPGTDNFYAGPSREFIQALAERSMRGELQDVTKTIEAWEGFPKAKRAIDIGGGHSLYAIALCQANPGLKAVVFDKPHVVPFTGEYIKRYSMEGRVSVQGGDILQDDLGNGYDIVVISHLLYKFRKDLPAIFSKVSGCMNPGGLLVTNHWFCSPSCGTAPGGIQELDKSLNSFGHPLCHPDDFSASLGKNGFEVLAVKDVPSIYGASKMYLATKGPSVRKNGASKKKSSCAWCE